MAATASDISIVVEIVDEDTEFHTIVHATAFSCVASKDMVVVSASSLEGGALVTC